MTRRSPCVLVTTLCCLLALATSASAECAWVSWKAVDPNPRNTAVSGDIGPESFFVVSAHAGRTECNRTASSLYLQAMERKISTYLCLPDTVDPRGPKGK